MIHDSERREVARRLRAARGPSLMVLMGVLGVGGAHLFDRLADLIDPTCDRDALLALADDIDKQTDGSMFDIWLEDGHYIARRIREALGVKS